MQTIYCHQFSIISSLHEIIKIYQLSEAKSEHWRIFDEIYIYRRSISSELVWNLEGSSVQPVTG